MPRLSNSSPAKRAPLPRASDFATSFITDWETLSRTGRYNMRQLREAMLMLIANDGPLPPEWLDHPLKGDWAGYRECHIGGDFLLIYELKNEPKRNAIVFVRAGTHADLFRE